MNMMPFPQNVGMMKGMENRIGSSCGYQESQQQQSFTQAPHAFAQQQSFPSVAHQKRQQKNNTSPVVQYGNHHGNTRAVRQQKHAQASVGAAGTFAVGDGFKKKNNSRSGSKDK